MSWFTDLFKPKDEKEQFIKDLSDFTDKYFDSKYNQADLLKYLIDDDIDFIFELSNRGDGKTFSYYQLLLYIAKKYQLNTMLLVRHDEVVFSIKETINQILRESSYFDEDDFMYVNKREFFELYDKLEGRPVMTVSHLNNASDLKYVSSYIKQFPLILLEEFLTSESDYVSDEVRKILSIYTSIDRSGIIPLIKHPKIIALGNPETLESELLTQLNLYEVLSTAEFDKIYKYNDAVIRLRNNEVVKEEKNTRIYQYLGDNGYLKPKFNSNNYNIIKRSELDFSATKEITVETVDFKYKVFKFSNFFYLAKSDESPDFTTKAQNYLKGSNYLITKEDYFDRDLIDLDKIKFSDVHVKAMFNRDSEINFLNFYKLFKVKSKNTNTTKIVEEANNEYKNSTIKRMFLRKISKGY